MSISMFRVLGYSGAVSGAASIILNMARRLLDTTHGTDRFSQHTADQHQKTSLFWNARALHAQLRTTGIFSRTFSTV